jgi:hypothetical protein
MPPSLIWDILCSKDTAAQAIREVILDHILTVYDPLDGERGLPQATFLTAWAMMHNLTLLIQH